MVDLSPHKRGIQTINDHLSIVVALEDLAGLKTCPIPYILRKTVKLISSTMR